MLWGYDVAAKKLDLTAALRDARQGGGLGRHPRSARSRRSRITAAPGAGGDLPRVWPGAGEPPAVPVAEPRRRKKSSPAPRGPACRNWRRDCALFGDLPGTARHRRGRSADYGGAVVDAVKSFQRRHGLDADGVIGAGTVRALNVSLARAIRQIELSMERMRWLPALSDRPNVFVNVALFRMWATDPATGEEPLRMNVVVGESLDHRTPIFVEQMEYVIFRPYWNPPRGITVKEIVPQAQRDPNYFARETAGDRGQRRRRRRRRCRRRPRTSRRCCRAGCSCARSPARATRSAWPSSSSRTAEDVYMHGTPAQSLFARARRDFSHGCIRLEDPARFAEWVLRDQPEWTRGAHQTRPCRANGRRA